MSNTVIILDGNQRSALAATRSLGSKGLRIVVGDDRRASRAGSSRYCSKTFRYPSPYEDPDGFLDAVLETAQNCGAEMILPTADISMYHVLKNRERFRDFLVPCASFDQYEALTDKWKLFETAKRLGLSIPDTHFIRTQEDLALIGPTLRFPLVVKPYRSRILLNGEWIRAGVHYANSFGELAAVVREHEYFSQSPFLLQEYIEGEGRGVFALYDQGKPLAFFGHRRLREKPPSGGVSVLAESVPILEAARELTETLLAHVRWHGVVMVEFKVARDGTPYMLEVNARFWSTLQLAIDAGVDFPWMLYQLATGQRPEPIHEYKTGIRCRWLVGDLIHAWMTLTGKSVGPHLPRGHRWSVMWNFLNFFDDKVRLEILRKDDLRPFAYEIKQHLLKRAA